MLSESDLTILSLSLALASDDITLTDADKNQLINIAIELECCPQLLPDEWIDIKTKTIEPLFNSHHQLGAKVTQYQQILSELSDAEIREALPSKADFMAVFPGLGVQNLEPPTGPNRRPNMENRNDIYTAAPAILPAIFKEPETAKNVLQKLLEVANKRIL